MFDCKLARFGLQRPGGPAVRRYIGWATCLAITVSVVANGAYAQLSEMPARPKIIVASTLTAAPSAPVDLDIRIEFQHLVANGAYLEIRGLPPFATLSGGRALGKKSWSLPLDALPNLKLQLPEQASGRSELDLRLITKSYVVIAFASTELIIEPVSVVAGNDKKPDRSRAEPSQDPNTSLSQASKAAEHQRSETPVARPHDPTAAAKAVTEPSDNLIEKKFEEQKTGTDQMGSGNDQQKLAAVEHARQDEPKAHAEQRRDETVGPIPTQEQERPEPEDQQRQSGVETVKPHDARRADPGRDTEPQHRNAPGAETSVSVGSADAEPQPGKETQATTTPVAGTPRSEEPSNTQPKSGTTGTTKTALAAQTLTGPAEGSSADQEPRRADPESREKVASTIDSATSFAPVARAKPTETEAAAAKREQAERLLSRGELYMAQGNIVVARQYYHRAADMGVARAALKLAETHDPDEITRLSVVGLAANPAEATRWYQRASALGAAAADARLRRLETR